jgi:hypothetical protein
MAVEAAFGDTELRSDGLDADGVRAADGQRGQATVEPAEAGGSDGGGNGASPS